MKDHEHTSKENEVTLTVIIFGIGLIIGFVAGAVFSLITLFV